MNPSNSLTSENVNSFISYNGNSSQSANVTNTYTGPWLVTKCAYGLFATGIGAIAGSLTASALIPTTLTVLYGIGAKKITKIDQAMLNLVLLFEVGTALYAGASTIRWVYNGLLKGHRMDSGFSIPDESKSSEETKEIASPEDNFEEPDSPDEISEEYNSSSEMSEEYESSNETSEVDNGH